jgi:hypothetical protein
VAPLLRLGNDRARPQGGRVGVEPEHDLAAALLDERRQAIREAGVHAFVLPEGASPVDAAGCQPVAFRYDYWPGAPAPDLTAFFSDEPALNRGTLLAAIWIRSPVCGLTP